MRFPQGLARLTEAVWRFSNLGLLLTGAAVTAGAGSLPAHDLEVRAPRPPEVVETAVTLPIRVEVENRGVETWSAEEGFALSYHWFAEDGEMVVLDGRRTPLDDPVEPGERRVVNATLRTPDRAGRYWLQWDVVHEGVLWVSQVDPTPPELIAVTVAASHAFSVVKGEAPRMLVAGGSTNVRVTLRNEGVRSWPGGGRVFLAYHWLDGDGEPLVWEGRRTPITVAVPSGGLVILDATIDAPGAMGGYRFQWDMVEDHVCWFSQRGDLPEATVVLVWPRWPTLLGWSWAAVAVLAALVLVRRRLVAAAVGGWLGVDVVWCVVSIVLAQAWLMWVSEAGLVGSGWCFTIASALLIGGLLMLVGRRVRVWLSLSVVSAVSALAAADAIHHRFFGDLLSVAALRSAGQVTQVEASIRSLISVGDLWLVGNLVTGILLAVTLWRTDGEPSIRVRVPWAFASAVIMAVAGWIVLDSAVSFRQVFQSTQLARHVGALNLHAADAARTVLRLIARPELTTDELDEVQSFFDERRPHRAGTGPDFGLAAGHNLVMLQVESLQAFVVGATVKGVEVTPTLNEIAGKAFAFGGITDQTEEGRSADAELATQVSLLPPNRGAAAFLYAGNRFTGLAAILAARGYQTLSAVPFDGAFWNRRTTHRAYGYEQSLFAEDFAEGSTVGWGLDDRSFLSQAAARLANLPEPWCAYLLTLSLHHPFDGFPDELKEIDVGRWKGTPFGNYLHTMHYFDRALGDFLAALESADLADHTVVAIWGDHDAGFEWRPDIAAAIGRTPNPIGWYLSQRVPFVVLVPGAKAPPALGLHPAGHVDVAPTLLGLLGVDAAPYAFVGRNLLGSPGDGPVVGEYRCWHDQSHVYLRHGPRLSDGQCFNLDPLTEVAVEACSESFDVARRQVEVSGLVLEYDLQQRLAEASGD